MSIVVAMMTLSSAIYSTQDGPGFTHLGYPQHLRIILGIAKLTGAIILIVPGRVAKHGLHIRLD